MEINFINKNSLSVIAFNSFDSNTPLPCRLAVINDDVLTSYVMNDMAKDGKNISTIAIELAEDTALFGIAIADGLKDELVSKLFRKLSDDISSIRCSAGGDSLLENISIQIKTLKKYRDYSRITDLIYKVLHLGFSFKS